MAASVGVTGLVAAASGTWNALLARQSVASFTLNLTGAEFDSTEFANTSGIVPRQWLPGLRSATVSLEAFSATPVLGVVGNAASMNYATNIFEWDMTIAQAALDVTDFAITNAWRSFSPGLQDWQGSYSGFVDATTAIANITEATASPTMAAATFTISSGNTLAGNILTRGGGVTVAVGDRNIVRYEYRGDNELTIVGTDALITANSGTMASLAAGTLVLSATASRTYTGSFIPTSIQVRVAQGELTRIRATGQLTGALTIA